jgi:hypothetical protein
VTTPFFKSVNRQGAACGLETPQGSVAIRYVPLRVVATGKGCEVLFTLFRLPDMSESQFEEDSAVVRRDLQALKQLMESQADPY